MSVSWHMGHELREQWHLSGKITFISMDLFYFALESSFFLGKRGMQHPVFCIVSPRMYWLIRTHGKSFSSLGGRYVFVALHSLQVSHLSFERMLDSQRRQ